MFLRVASDRDTVRRDVAARNRSDARSQNLANDPRFKAADVTLRNGNAGCSVPECQHSLRMVLAWAAYGVADPGKATFAAAASTAST